MADFRKLGNAQAGGWNDVNSVQLMQAGGSTVLYLYDAPGWDVSIDDESIARIKNGKDQPAAQKGHTIHKIDILAGNKFGSTVLRAKAPGGGGEVAAGIYITQSSNLSLVGKKIGDMAPEMRAALKSMPLRDAVIAIALDQMNGKASKEGKGFGYYGDIKVKNQAGEMVDANWCGEFCVWCWKQALHVHGLKDPFSSYYDLASAQQAITWAMLKSTPAQLLRYSGGFLVDRWQRKDHNKSEEQKARVRDLDSLSQEYREIGWNGNQLERGDIVLVRDDAGVWRHVCMIDTVDGTSLGTIEGNVYGGGSFEPGKQLTQSIARLKRDRDHKIPKDQWKYVYVHMTY
jgi:hypothetical protein